MHKEKLAEKIEYTYGTSILCPVCSWCIIPIEQVWCGCKPIPRKLKKWCKKRQAAYKG